MRIVRTATLALDLIETPNHQGVPRPFSRVAAGEGTRFSMPFLEHHFPDPRPDNPGREHVIRTNPDCPRCGYNCEHCEFDGPDTLMHCPGCKGGLVTMACNDWTDDPMKNVESSYWFERYEWDVSAKGDPECCAGCELMAKAVSP
jgi:hypothetical protein